MQASMEIGRLAGIHAHRQAGRHEGSPEIHGNMWVSQTCWQASRHADRQAIIITGRLTGIHADRQAGRQADRRPPKGPGAQKFIS